MHAVLFVFVLIFMIFFFLSIGFREQGFPCIDYISLMLQLQSLKGCCDTLQSLQDHYRVELVHREIPVICTGNGFAVQALSF